MNKLALGALFVGLAACGGGGGGNNPDVVITVDAPDTTGACNPLTQTGCSAGEKCTWWTDQENPPIGHVGCAPDGTIAQGAACTDPVAGPMGYDQCAKGSVCLSGICKQICSVDGGTPTCDANSVCTRYADFFEVGGAAVAGVCDPGCDPLTQDLKVGSPSAACGSTNPAEPNSGCYGFDEFSCAPTGGMTLDLVDRSPPRTNSAGNPYLNGCAPGFIPFFYESTGSTNTVCTGYCAAKNVDSSIATRDTDKKGDTAASAKLPREAASAVGNATCAIGKKGGDASSECVWMWPYLVDDTTGELPAQFEQLYADKLGICMAIGQYRIDIDQDGMATDPFPSCAGLPPSTADMNDIDALDWGCYDWTTTGQMSALQANKKPVMPAGKASVRLPKDAPMQIIRHSFN